MRVLAATGIGAVLGLVAAGAAARANSLEALFGLGLFILVLPVIGGTLIALRGWLNHDPEAEHPPTVRQRSGQSAGVAAGLVLGAVVGMLFGLGSGG
jgi:hypothetical protein